MKNFKSLLSLCFILFIFQIYPNAQSSINTSFSQITGANGSLTYSIGQVVYHTNYGVNGIVSEGVQQAFEIYPLGIGAEALNMILEIYPNPTSQFLMLTSSDEFREEMFYEIYDTMGNLLDSKELMGIQTEIDLRNLDASTYFIRVTNGALGEKVFKVIKTE